MRRILQVSGLLLSGFLSTQAVAEEAADADPQPTDEAAPAPAPSPVAPAVSIIVPTAPVAAPVDKPKVGDMTAHGYWRGGFGASNQKGRMTCFQLALTGGLLSKYRLGNECEVWSELHLTTVVHAGDDGSVARLHFMPVAFIPTTYIGYSPTGITSSDLNSPNTGAAVAFPVLYTDIQGIPWLAGGTAWVGTRYYKRESIYISDFFYWNPSGVGAGIEDIHIGKYLSSPVLRDLTLSYAAFAVDGQPNGSPQLPMQIDFGLRNDLQIRGLKPGRAHEIQLGFQYIVDWSDDKDANGKSVTHGGWGVTARWVWELLGGDNKLAVQYGKGGGTGFGTLSRFYYPDFSLRWDPKESRIRVVDVLTIQPTSWLGTQVGFVWQRDDMGTGVSGAKTDWLSLGSRVAFAPIEHFKVLAEYGWDKVQKTNGSDVQVLHKRTLALAITASRGFWARPELRLFGTWASWNEAARGATVDSGRLYTATDKLDGYIFGIQAETMW
jgi:maltoporin